MGAYYVRQNAGNRNAASTPFAIPLVALAWRVFSLAFTPRCKERHLDPSIAAAAAVNSLSDVVKTTPGEMMNESGARVALSRGMLESTNIPKMTGLARAVRSSLRHR